MSWFCSWTLFRTGPCQFRAVIALQISVLVQRVGSLFRRPNQLLGTFFPANASRSAQGGGRKNIFDRL
jgi:hypothetical protein